MSQDPHASNAYLKALVDGFSTEHARKVAACTAGFVALGGFSGSAIAAIKYAPAIPAAFHSALSTGAPAFAFFSVREYFMLPTYTYLRANGSLPKITSLHFRNTPESASAGFVTGAALGIYHFRQSTRAISGGFTFAVFALAGQLAVNELNILRINYITRHTAATHAATAENDDQFSEAPAHKPPLWQRTTEKLLAVTPIRKVSNEEYVETLNSRIQSSEQELRVVNGQIEYLQQRFERLEKEKDDFLS